VVRATQDVDLDVEVQLAHSLDQRFARIFVCRDLEGGVFLNHLVQRHTHLLGAGLVLRRNSDRDHRVRKYHRLKRGRVLWIRKRVACTCVLHAEQGDDVTGLRSLELLARVGVHLDDAADTLGLARERVQYAVAFLQCARVDAGERQGAVAVVHDLECQRAQRFLRIHLGE